MEAKVGKIGVAKIKRRGEETEEGREEKEKTKKKKDNGSEKVMEKWKIWDKEKEAKKLVSSKFYK